MPEEYVEQSEWNSNLIIIRILGELRVRIIDASTQRNYSEYYNNLDQYWSQLSGVVTKAEDIALHELLRSKTKIYADLIRGVISQGRKQIPIIWCEMFKIWEKELYKTQQKYNLGIGLKDDPRLAAMKT